jgi:hypothetical protein
MWRSTPPGLPLSLPLGLRLCFIGLCLLGLELLLGRGLCFLACASLASACSLARAYACRLFVFSSA